jgi:hypothetical protein
MNMTYQVLGAGMISLGVVVGVACIFCVGLMIFRWRWWVEAETVNNENGEKWQRQWK